MHCWARQLGQQIRVSSSTSTCSRRAIYDCRMPDDGIAHGVVGSEPDSIRAPPLSPDFNFESEEMATVILQESAPAGDPLSNAAFAEHSLIALQVRCTMWHSESDRQWQRCHAVGAAVCAMEWLRGTPYHAISVCATQTCQMGCRLKRIGHGSMPVSSLAQHAAPTKKISCPRKNTRLTSPKCQVACP